MGSDKQDVLKVKGYRSKFARF